MLHVKTLCICKCTERLNTIQHFDGKACFGLLTWYYTLSSLDGSYIRLERIYLRKVYVFQQEIQNKTRRVSDRQNFRQIARYDPYSTRHIHIQDTFLHVVTFF